MSPAAEGGLVGGGVLVNAQWIGLEAANWKNISSVLVVFFFFWLFAGAVPALSLRHAGSSLLHEGSSSLTRDQT